MGIFHDFFARNYLSISKITWKMALSLKLPIKSFFDRNSLFFLSFITITKVLCLFRLFIFFFYFSGGCEDMPILQAFFTNFSLETIYLSPDIRENGYIFKTSTQKKKISTQCIILFIFLWFSQIKIGGDTFCPPPYHN